MANVTQIDLAHLPPDMAVYVALYSQLENAKFLRQQLLDGNTDYEYAFLDASTILSTTHLLAAVFRAINDSEKQRMKSRNIHAEIVCALSPNNNIAEAYRTFGITEKTRDLVVVKILRGIPDGLDRISRHLGKGVEGKSVVFDEERLREVADLSKIKKIYKLNAAASAKGAQRKKGQQEPRPEEPLTDVMDERKEMEAIVLGLIALRGAS